MLLEIERAFNNGVGVDVSEPMGEARSFPKPSTCRGITRGQQRQELSRTQRQWPAELQTPSVESPWRGYRALLRMLPVGNQNLSK